MTDQRIRVSERGSVLVGTAGWSYPDWQGIVYPAGMPKKVHPLTFLSKHFDTVEINSTFYRPARPDYAARWVRCVENRPGFMFTAKLWKRFTHERNDKPKQMDVDTVKKGVQPLAEAGRLGCLLAQFPWSFRNVPENRDWMDTVLTAFSEYPLAVEVRHASWNVPEVYEYLQKKHAAMCNIDQPMYRDSIAPADIMTARIGYVRMHGRNHENWFRKDADRNDRYDYLYSSNELDPWIETIKRMQDVAETVYVITNNHYRGQAVVNAFEIEHMLTGEKICVPESILKTYPRLEKITTPSQNSSRGQMTIPGM